MQYVWTKAQHRHSRVALSSSTSGLHLFLISTAVIVLRTANLKTVLRRGITLFCFATNLEIEGKVWHKERDEKKIWGTECKMRYKDDS